MDEVIKSIKAFLYDRTVSPLFGAYITAWSVWNYRVIAALLDSDASLSEKMGFIDAYFGIVAYQINGQSYFVWGEVIRGILGPLLLTFFYIYIYPLLAEPVYKHSLAKQKALKNVKQDLENARLLTVEESRELMKEIEQIRYKADEEAQKYRIRIASLTETISTLEEAKRGFPLSQLADGVIMPPQPKLGLEELGNLVRNKVEALPSKEFQLSDLFTLNDWKALSDSNRQEYGKLFKQLVERGDFSGVVLSRKGTGNLQMYKKENHISSMDLLNIERELDKFFPLEIFDSADQRTDLLHTFSAYCVKKNISVDMFNILLLFVLNGGVSSKGEIKNHFGGDLSIVELDHILNELKDKRLIDSTFGTISLSDIGKKMAVESGLAKLGTLYNKRS
ncbi:MAG: DUF1413 domain-containing protein [Gallionellaceae bacterium]|jgi:hypothetical protein